MTLLGCRTDPSSSNCEADCGVDLSLLDAPPRPDWLDADADVVVGDVEFIDPGGALDEMDVRIEYIQPSALGPHDHALAAWAIEPSGELESIVYARFPLPDAQNPGDTLELWTEGDEGWWGQSYGTVTDDGMHVVAPMVHFSRQSVSLPNEDRLGFASGRFCSGGMADQPAMVANAHFPADSRESEVNGALTPEATRPTHATMMERLTDLAHPDAVGEGMLFKNEERAGSSTVCDGNYNGVPGYEDEDYFGDPALVEPLRQLSERVRTLSCGTLKLVSTETFDTLDEHSSASLHYDGRAVDLALIGTDAATGAVDCRARRYTYGLGRLAQLATEAGFGFVLYEAPSRNRNLHHVHASVAVQTEDPAEPDVLPPNTFEATLVLGDQTHRMSSTEMVRGTRGEQLTMTATDFVDDVWTTIVLVLPDEQANGDFAVGGGATVEVSRDAQYVASSGTITFEQVLPFEDKNYLTTTGGSFEVTIEGEAGSGTVEGRFIVDDLVFWGL